MYLNLSPPGGDRGSRWEDNLEAFRDIKLPQCLILNLFIFYSVETTHPFLQAHFLFSHPSHHRLRFWVFFLTWWCSRCWTLSVITTVSCDHMKRYMLTLFIQRQSDCVLLLKCLLLVCECMCEAEEWWSVRQVGEKLVFYLTAFEGLKYIYAVLQLCHLFQHLGSCHQLWQLGWWQNRSVWETFSTSCRPPGDAVLFFLD